MSNEYQPNRQELIGALLYRIANAQNLEIVHATPVIEFMTDDEFLKFLDKVDKLGDNCFHFASRRALKDRMTLMIEKLERVASRERIRSILSTLSQSSHNMLQLAATQNECPEAHQILWNFIRKNFNESEVSDMLKHTDPHGNNVLHLSVLYNTLEVVKVILNEISKTCESDQQKLSDYLKSVNNKGENILHLVMKTNNEGKLSFLWNKLKNTQLIKELLLQQTSEEEKLYALHFATLSGGIEFYLTLWNLLLNTFSKREELMSLLLQKTAKGNNFFHYIVTFNRPNIIELSIQRVKEVFSDAQYKKILGTKGQMDRNLLRIATVGSKDIETHKLLWKIFKDIYKPKILDKVNIFKRPTPSDNSETFLKILTENDSQNFNIIYAAACFTTGEIIEFMFNELEKIATREEIMTMLSQLSLMDRNILHIAAGRNKSLTAHQELWKAIHKHFNRSEIIKMIKHGDESGFNVLTIVAEVNTMDIAELTWKEITEILSSSELTELLRYSKINNENIIFSLMKLEDEKRLSFFYKRIENHFMQQSGLSSNLNQTQPESQIRSNDMFMELLTQKTSDTKSSFLLFAVISEKLEFYKTLWELLINTFDNREVLNKLVLCQSESGLNFVSAMILLGKSDIIEYILTKFTTTFSKRQFKEILKLKEGIGNNNLYQVATVKINDIRTYQFLWKLASEYLDLSEILEIIEHKDKNGSNLLGHIALLNSKSIAEFTWNQIKSVYSKFENKGLKELLTNTNNDGETFFFTLVMRQHESKFRYFCLELEFFLSNQELKDFLCLKNQTNYHSILHLTAYCSNMEFNNNLWEFLLKTFTNREELKKIILDETKQALNYVSIMLMYSEVNIIELNFQKLKKNFTEIQQKEIFATKFKNGKNLIQFAAVCSKELKTHQILWKALKNICKSEKEFLEILKETEDFNCNVFYIAVISTTEEVFKFMIEILEKVASRQEIKKILNSGGCLDGNLLQMAVITNTECAKFHRFLWKVIKNYFDHSEIVEMIKHIDKNGQNLLKAVVRYNKKNVVQQYWEEIKTVLGKEIFEYLRHTDKKGDNIIHSLVLNRNIEVLKYFWEELASCSNSFDVFNNSNQSKRKFELTPNLILNLINQKCEANNMKILHFATYSKEVKFHEAFWDLLLNSVKSQDVLNSLIIQKSNDGMNFLHFLVTYKALDVVEYSLKKIKHVLSDAQFKEVLTSSEDKYKFNLLQIASHYLEDVEKYQKFWNIINKYADTSTILELLKHSNFDEDNILQLVLKLNSKQITKVTWNKIKTFANETDSFDIKEYLNKINSNNANVLHILLKNQNSDELKFYWNEFEECFNSQKEFKEFISRIRSKTKQTILHIVSECTNIEFQQTIWSLLLKAYDNQEQLMKFLMHTDINGSTFLFSAACNNNVYMITFMLNKLKENLHAEQCADLLKVKGIKNKNIIQIAAVGSKNLDKYQILHQNVQNSCQSNQNYLKYFTDIDTNGCNLIHTTATTSSSEIFEYTIQSLEQIENRIEIKKILSSKSLSNASLLQNATFANSSIDTHKSLWKIIKKYFTNFEIFKMIYYNDNDFGCNLWAYAMISPQSSEDIIKLIWNEIKNVFKMFGESFAKEMLLFLKQTNVGRESIVYYLIREKHEKLELYWTICQNFFKAQNLPNHFKDLITQQYLSSSKNVLHAVAKTNKVECHTTIWKLLVKMFDDSEELKNFILEKDENGDGFFVNLFQHCQPDIIKFTFEKINEALSDDQYQEIIKSEHKMGKNLLQVAVCISKDIKVHQILWLILKNSCKSNDEFLEFLDSTDDDYSNIFHDAASFALNSSYFEFVTEELTKITTNDKIRRVLYTNGSKNQNLLQISAFNKKIEIFQSLWKIVSKYFDCLEMLNIISHADKNGLNLIHYIAEYDLNKINDITIEEVSKLLSSNKIFNDCSNNMSDLWNKCKFILKSKPQSAFTRIILRSTWSELVKNINIYDSLEIHNKVINKQILFDEHPQGPLEPSLKDYKTIHRMIYCEQIEVQKASWKIMFDSFVNKNEIKNILLLKNVDGNNFIHSLVLNENSKVIELLFQLMKENLNTEQFHQVLRSKGQYGSNILYTAALHCKNIKVHQILWKFFREAFSDTFLGVLKETDENDDNILQIAVRFATKENVDFIFNQLEELASPDEIKIILKTNGRGHRNLLQMIAEECFLPEIHSILWNIFRKYFNPQEVVNCINYCDKDGNRLIHNSVFWNKKEIVNLTWEEIKTFITSKDDQIDYLKTTGFKEQNLKQISEDNKKENSEVKIWVDQVLSEYGIVLNSE